MLTSDEIQQKIDDAITPSEEDLIRWCDETRKLENVVRMLDSMMKNLEWWANRDGNSKLAADRRQFREIIERETGIET